MARVAIIDDGNELWAKNFAEILSTLGHSVQRITCQDEGLGAEERLAIRGGEVVVANVHYKRDVLLQDIADEAQNKPLIFIAGLPERMPNFCEHSNVKVFSVGANLTDLYQHLQGTLAPLAQER